MSRLGHGLAGVGEVPLEAGQGVDSSLERRPQPACELVSGARLVDADDPRFDRAVVSGAEPGELVGRTAPRQGRARYEIGGSARDQRRHRERVKGRPRGGRVSVPSRRGVEPQAGVATDPRKPLLDVTRGGWLRAIRREKQRLVAVSTGAMSGEPLCVQQRQERRWDPVAAREAAVGRHRRERQPLRSVPGRRRSWRDPHSRDRRPTASARSPGARL